MPSQPYIFLAATPRTPTYKPKSSKNVAYDQVFQASYFQLRFGLGRMLEKAHPVSFQIGKLCATYLIVTLA